MSLKLFDFRLAPWLDRVIQERKGGESNTGAKEGTKRSRIHPIQPDHYRAPEVLLLWLALEGFGADIRY